MSRWPLWGKINFSKKHSLYHFRTFSENISPLSKIFHEGCQNCIQRVQRNTLRKNSFEKIQLLFSNIEPKNFRPSGQSFSTGWWKLKVYGNIETFFEKSNFFIILGHWARKISAGLSILHSTHPWHLEKSFLLNKVNFLIFSGDWAKKIRASGTIFFGRVVKTPLYVSKEMLWGKTNLKGIIFNIIFGHSAKTFRLFVKKFSAGFSILHSTHPWHLEKSFLLNKVNFLIFFGNWAKNFLAPGTIFFRQGCQNCIIRVCRNKFEDKKIVWKKYNLYHFRILREKLSDFCEKVYGRVVKAA